MTIVDAIYSYLPAKRKNTPSGWTKFNAVCCHNNGTSKDTRQRAGVIKTGEGLSYHCFNCGYKTSYQPGRHLTRKMRHLMSWLGMPDDLVNKLALEALKIESDQQEIEKITIPNFVEKPLPEESLTVEQAVIKYPEAGISVAEYILSRSLDITDYDFRWSPEFPDRVIIPFYYQGKIVGYTGRKITEGKPKYLSEQTPGYVFNLDNQLDTREFVIVVEGPLDAISIDAVAILGADIMDKQALLINRLGKKIIVVPDRDTDGQRTVKAALANGWGVSMPDWPEGVKDTNDAVRKLGKLYTLYSILNSAEFNDLKIQLRMKKWFE